MPVIQCPNGKWRIGDGPCMYESKEKATRAYIAYLAQHPKETQSFKDKRFDEEKFKEKFKGGEK